MNNIDFCWWLQGFFEIDQTTNLKLEEAHLNLLRSHLDLVRAVDGKLEEFQSWLSGFIDGKMSLNIEDTYKIKTRLADIFEHVIDPKYEIDNKDKLQKLHDAFNQKPSDDMSTTLYRC